MAKRQPFTKEFKREAIRLWKSSGKPAAAIARELGLRRNHLYKWHLELETHGDAAFPGKGGGRACQRSSNNPQVWSLNSPHPLPEGGGDGT